MKHLVIMLAACSCIAEGENRYQAWLDEDVVYIITDQEKRDFQQLRTDSQRAAFIQDFWEVRNPMRGSGRNPAREEHYRRIEYANREFGRDSNTPGWRTDRGRTYILFGAPLNRTPFIGFSQIYPLELWFYANEASNPTFPSFFYILFFMPEDIGDFRFYRPGLDGPLKLVRGTRFRTGGDVYRVLQPLGGDLAHAALSLIPSEPVDTVNFRTSLSSDTLVAKIQNYANDRFYEERIRQARTLRAKVDSWLLLPEERALDLTWFVMADVHGRHWLDYAFPITSESLGYIDVNKSQFILRSGFRLLTPAGDLILEDEEEDAYPLTPSVSAATAFAPVLLANRVPLVPGKYRLEVYVTNRKTGRVYSARAEVDALESKSVSIGPLLLADSATAVSADGGWGPFRYFDVQFRPALRRSIWRRQPLTTLLQLTKGQDSGGNLILEYVLGHAQDKSLRRTFTDDVAATEFLSGRLLKAKSLPVSDLPPGEYLLAVRARAENSTQVLASATKSIRLGDEKEELPLRFTVNSRRASVSGVAAYLRGLEALVQDPGLAARYFRKALQEDRGNMLAVRMLVQIHFHAGRFTEVVGLYREYGLAAFEAPPRTLTQLALSLWHSGDSTEARKVLEVGLRQFPEDELLAATARRLQ